MKNVENTSVDYNKMNVGFKIESVDFENKVCTLRVYSGRKSKVFEGVYMSGLLISRMTGEKSAPYYLVGKKYSSENNETFRKTNPFQLIRYGNIEQPNHLLTVVEDAGTKRVNKGKDILGNDMYQTVFRPWYKKEQYRRFRNLAKVVEQVKEETATA